MKQETVVWLTTNPVATWWIRHVASKLDPLLFRASGGRWFSMGRASMPMITLTTTGRKTGKPRHVHLACLEREGGWLVWASNMGGEKHPAWSHNLEAHPELEVQVEGERCRARARRLSAEQKAAVWDEVRRAVPQLDVYTTRTDRDIRLYQLTRV